MISVEFHCHTHASADSLTSPQVLVKTARRKGIDRLIITDHNSISGALEARAIDPGLVIIGEEIMTTRGEILAAFVREEIPPGLTPRETLLRLKDQSAFISVSHPFDTMRKGGWLEADLLEILPLVDAIEVFNSRCMMPGFNQNAAEFARQHNLAGTVGSDAHAAFEVGRSRVLVEPFSDSDGLRQVIRKGRFETRWSPPWFHLTSRFATIVKKIHFNS